MFLRIVFLLQGLIFVLDYAIGNNCGGCQTNHVACHSEDTFSLCVKGKSRDTVIQCPEGKVCTSDKAVCVQKNNDEVKPSCVASCNVCGSQGRVFSCVGKKHFEFCFGENKPFLGSRGSCLDGYVCDHTQSQICVNETDSKPSCVDDLVLSNEPTGGSSYGTQDAPKTEIFMTTPESTVSDVPDGKFSRTSSNYPSTTKPQKGATFSSTIDSYTTFDLTDEADVSYGVVSGITPEPSKTHSQKDDISSTTRVSDTSLDTSTKNEGVSLITEKSSITESQEGPFSSSTHPYTSEPTQSSSSSTQHLSNSGFPANGFQTTIRNAKTFCSETKQIGTFRAEGDTTSKRYFICMTYKGGFKGYEYNCGFNYFNSETSQCQAEIPGKY